MYTFGNPLSPPLVSGFDATLVKYNNGDEEYIQAEQVVLNKHGEPIGGMRIHSLSCFASGMLPELLD